MRLQRSLWAGLLSATTAAGYAMSASAPADDDFSVALKTSKLPVSFSAKCASIAAGLSIGHSTLYFSQFVLAGTTLNLTDNDPSCTQPSIEASADMCRIALYISTSSSSGFNMEAWLPANWTGRFLGTGNGGLNGCISYADLSYGTSLGFAAVGSNNGHNGTSGQSFYKSPGVVEDFVYRATVIGKEISVAFYGNSLKKSYYLGCSTGGRQGFKAAQDFPGDFDGIVAGAPALAFNNLTSWSGHFYKLTGPPGSPTFVSQSQWFAVHNDVLKQCDALDGNVDGIIEDPRLCNYDPSGLACGAGNTSPDCLTAPQLKTVKGVYSPTLTDNGDLVYPRLQPGAEIIGFFVLFNGVPFPYTTDWFRYVIYNDPSWDPTTITSADYINAARKNPFNVETWKGDLSAVKNRGAKIIHWHGGADFIISSDNSPRYYEHVSKTMGLSPAQLDSFYRYFLVSGTGHCGGGDGAHAIGQGLGEVNSYDPKENVLMALVDWVEKNKAPETLTGTKWVNDTQALGIDFQRAHCKYPKRNKYAGKGNPKLPGSWKCVDL